MTNKLVLAYMAGFVDGDGCLAITRKKNRLTPKVVIAQKTIKILHLFQKYYGGYVGFKNNNGSNKNWIYQWEISYNKAVKFIEDIYPYLIIKKENAKLILQFKLLTEKQTTKKLTMSDMNKRYKIKNKMHKLNAKKERPSGK